MKNNAPRFIVLLGLLLFVTCTVNRDPLSNSYDKYEGSWRWIKTIGGFAPRVITPEEGQTVIIRYDDQLKYRLFRNDTLKVSAHYSIEKTDHYGDKFIYTHISTYDYHFDRESEFATLHGDTIEIWDGMIDGYFSWYVRE